MVARLFTPVTVAAFVRLKPDVLRNAAARSIRQPPREFEKTEIKKYECNVNSNGGRKDRTRRTLV